MVLLFVFLTPRNITGMPVSSSMATPPFRSSFLTYRPFGCEFYCLRGIRSTSLRACPALIMWTATFAAWNNICNSLLLSYFRYLSSLIQTSTCHREFHFRSQYFSFGPCNGPLPLSAAQCGCDHNVMKCQYRILSRFISKCSNCTKCCLQHLYSLCCFPSYLSHLQLKCSMLETKLEYKQVMHQASI